MTAVHGHLSWYSRGVRKDPPCVFARRVTKLGRKRINFAEPSFDSQVNCIHDRDERIASMSSAHNVDRFLEICRCRKERIYSFRKCDYSIVIARPSACLVNCPYLSAAQCTTAAPGLAAESRIALALLYLLPRSQHFEFRGDELGMQLAHRGPGRVSLPKTARNSHDSDGRHWQSPGDYHYGSLDPRILRYRQ